MRSLLKFKFGKPTASAIVEEVPVVLLCTQYGYARQQPNSVDVAVDGIYFIGHEWKQVRVCSVVIPGSVSAPTLFTCRQFPELVLVACYVESDKCSDAVLEELAELGITYATALHLRKLLEG